MEDDSVWELTTAPTASSDDLLNYMLQNADGLQNLFKSSEDIMVTSENGPSSAPQFAQEQETKMPPPEVPSASQPMPKEDLQKMISNWVAETGGNVRQQKKRKLQSSSDEPSPKVPNLSSLLSWPKINLPESSATPSSETIIIPSPSVSSDSLPSPPSPASPRAMEMDEVKGKLMDLVLFEKDINNFCKKAIEFVAKYVKAEVAGFFLNDHQNLKDWSLCSSYPSVNEFNNSFSFETAYHLILQAALTKKPITSNAINKDFTFTIEPLFTHSALSGKGLGLLVFGVKKTDSKPLQLPPELAAVLTSSLRAVQMELENERLRDNLEQLKSENQKLKQIEQFDILRDQVATLQKEANKQKLISSLNQTILNSLTSSTDACIICTNVKGTITYFSNGAQQLLGHTPAEVIGHFTPVKFHVEDELKERSLELEKELNKKLSGFEVLVENARQGMAETRQWTFIKKDESTVAVDVTVRPLVDPGNTLIGFIEIAKENETSTNKQANKKNKSRAHAASTKEC